MTFDTRRAMLKGPDLFSRFKFTNAASPLAEVGFADHERLLVFKRKEAKRALRVRQMAYHHAAQGELDGCSFLITY